MDAVPTNIRMAARLVAGAIRRIREKKREKQLDKAPHGSFIDIVTKGDDNEQVETR